MFSQCIFIVLLFQLVASIIVIDPVDPVLRSGQSVTFRCKAPSSVKSCIWIIDSDFNNPGDTYGTFENGECSFKLVVPVKHQVIKVSCSVCQNKNPQRIDLATTSITTIVLPKLELDHSYGNDTITAMAGKERKLTCTVAGARPKPDVLWKIGERQISEGITTNSTTDGDGLVTIVDTLRYTFAASDHGQMLRCITAGSWIDVEEDEYLASGLLNVMFFPQPQGTQYRLVGGQIRYIAVYFAANPSPTRAWWTLEEDGRIDVPTELANFSPADKSSNYEAYTLKRVNNIDRSSASRVVTFSQLKIVFGKEIKYSNAF